MNIPIRVGLSPTLRIRGLLADADIKKGQILERCPVILVHAREQGALEQTVVDRYVYVWNAQHVAVALGYGSLYNHSYTPNVRWGFNYKAQLAIFTAVRDIAAGEELFINYSGEGVYALDPVEPKFVDFDPHRQPK
jgi:hypothetical protein